MATVTETGAFVPLIQTWDTPMRPNNTPVRPGAPIGRVTWFSSDNTAAKDAADVVELAITLAQPANYAMRLMNVNWQIQIQDAGAIGDINDWNDDALLTVPGANEDTSWNLSKMSQSSNAQATITNLFVSCMYLPGGGVSSPSNHLNYTDPFLPTTPMIFRVCNLSANAVAVTSFFSHMWAYLYTIEQYNEGSIWTAVDVGGGS